MSTVLGVVLCPKCLNLLLYEGESWRLLINSPLLELFPFNLVLADGHTLEFV